MQVLEYRKLKSSSCFSDDCWMRLLSVQLWLHAQDQSLMRSCIRDDVETSYHALLQKSYGSKRLPPAYMCLDLDRHAHYNNPPHNCSCSLQSRNWEEDSNERAFPNLCNLVPPTHQLPCQGSRAFCISASTGEPSWESLHICSWLRLDCNTNFAIVLRSFLSYIIIGLNLDNLTSAWWFDSGLCRATFIHCTMTAVSKPSWLDSPWTRLATVSAKPHIPA